MKWRSGPTHSWGCERRENSGSKILPQGLHLCAPDGLESALGTAGGAESEADLCDQFRYLVETPVIVCYIDLTLAPIAAAAAAQGLPLPTEKVSPKVDRSFWLNLIDRGYRAGTCQRQ